MVIITLFNRAPSEPRALNTPCALSWSIDMPCIFSNTATIASIVCPWLIISTNSPFVNFNADSMPRVLLWMLVNTLLKAVALTSAMRPILSEAEPKASNSAVVTCDTLAKPMSRFVNSMMLVPVALDVEASLKIAEPAASIARSTPIFGIRPITSTSLDRAVILSSPISSERAFCTLTADLAKASRPSMP